MPLNVSGFKLWHSESPHRVKLVFIGKPDEKTPSHTIAHYKRTQDVRWESNPEPILRGGHYVFHSALVKALVLICRNIQTHYYLFQYSTSRSPIKLN